VNSKLFTMLLFKEEIMYGIPEVGRRLYADGTIVSVAICFLNMTVIRCKIHLRQTNVLNSEQTIITAKM
jgi:hypothetical protein